jgi:hypothetical protein
MPNPLLRETLEYIESHPEDWDQRDWICDTGMCFFGHALMLSGKAKLTNGWFKWNNNRHVQDVTESVSALLGITLDDGFILSNQYIDTVEQLRKIVERLDPQ